VDLSNFVILPQNYTELQSRRTQLGEIVIRSSHRVDEVNTLNGGNVCPPLPTRLSPEVLNGVEVNLLVEICMNSCRPGLLLVHINPLKQFTLRSCQCYQFPKKKLLYLKLNGV
jgi:hypothetical protein